MSAGEAATATQEATLPVETVTAEAVQEAASSRRARREAAAVAAAVVATAAAVAEAPAAATELDVIAPVEPELTVQPLAAPAALTAPEVVTPEVSETPVSEASSSARIPSVPTPAPGESAADAFAAAASAFGIAAEAPSRSTRRSRSESVPTADDAASEASAPAHQVRRRFGVPRKVLAGSATVGIMGIAGMIAVSMTLPSTAIAAAQVDGTQAATSLVSAEAGTDAAVTEEEIQAYVASSDVKGEQVVRADDFSTISLSDLAAEEGIAYSSSLYTNNPDAAIQWPFVVGVAMSSTYGMRNGRMHEGIDLVPGAGAPIQSIADGTVRLATEAGGNYGVTVYIDHEIDGQIITSHYSHMQYGSLRVQTGDKVKVGDIVGTVGNTGRSYGAHLHFELILNGAKIDPLPWLQQNTGRMSY
ncbi:M23 family metallopeptidase [Microbacterium sp. Mu-43]|uniref:M23 family metallopeptidase n=1 Tax=Microbacterium istanbulense TaxID=3122049 RepID=A0ABU8LH95_9MICO